MKGFVEYTYDGQLRLLNTTEIRIVSDIDGRCWIQRTDGFEQPCDQSYFQVKERIREASE